MLKIEKETLPEVEATKIDEGNFGQTLILKFRHITVMWNNQQQVF